MRLSYLAILVTLGCQDNRSARAAAETIVQDSVSLAATSSVWADDPALLEPVSASLVIDIISFTKRLDALSSRLANTRQADCEGASPTILPVINQAAILLDTLDLLAPMFRQPPPNLTMSAAAEWAKAGHAINFMFSDGQRLLAVSKVRPLSEALIRSYGLSLHERASQVVDALQKVSISL